MKEGTRTRGKLKDRIRDFFLGTNLLEEVPLGVMNGLLGFQDLISSPDGLITSAKNTKRRLEQDPVKLLWFGLDFLDLGLAFDIISFGLQIYKPEITQLYDSHAEHKFDAREHCLGGLCLAEPSPFAGKDVYAPFANGTCPEGYILAYINDDGKILTLEEEETTENKYAFCGRRADYVPPCQTIECLEEEEAKQQRLRLTAYENGPYYNPKTIEEYEAEALEALGQNNKPLFERLNLPPGLTDGGFLTGGLSMKEILEKGKTQDNQGNSEADTNPTEEEYEQPYLTNPNVGIDTRGVKRRSLADTNNNDRERLKRFRQHFK